MQQTVALLPGGGIGAEVLAEAVKVLRSVGARFGHRFTFVESGCEGGPLGEEGLARCLAADSVLAGVGTGPALAQLAAAMKLRASIRPALLYPQLAGASPLAPALVERDIDLMLVQALELPGGEEEGGGQKGLFQDGDEGAARVARIAFRTAGMRRRGLVFVEQPGAPACNRAWLQVVRRTAAEYPAVSLTVLGASAMAAALLRQPANFDVILSDGPCGEMLAGMAAGMTGSAGMMSCAGMAVGGRGVYHPLLGPSPDLAGQRIANPVGAVYAGALLLKYVFGMMDECAAIEAAVQKVLDDGFRTVDILTPRCHLVSSDRFGDLIAAALTSPLLYRRVSRSVRAAGGRGGQFEQLHRRATGAEEL